MLVAAVAESAESVETVAKHQSSGSGPVDVVDTNSEEQEVPVWLPEHTSHSATVALEEVRCV